MIAAKDEVPADDKAFPASMEQDDATIPTRRRKNREGVNRRQRQIACKAERPPMREQEAAPCREAHRVGYALDGQPALARYHGVALDAFMLGELDGQFSTHIKATAHITARF